MLRNINRLLRRTQVPLRPSIRTFSLSSARFSDDDDRKFKNDPEVKKILSKIQEDFKPPDKNGDSDPKSGKNVRDLLSELYGDAELANSNESEKKEKESKFSSVGETSNQAEFIYLTRDFQEDMWSTRTPTTE